METFRFLSDNRRGRIPVLDACIIADTLIHSSPSQYRYWVIRDGFAFSAGNLQRRGLGIPAAHYSAKNSSEKILEIWSRRKTDFREVHRAAIHHARSSCTSHASIGRRRSIAGPIPERARLLGEACHPEKRSNRELECKFKTALFELAVLSPPKCC